MALKLVPDSAGGGQQGVRSAKLELPENAGGSLLVAPAQLEPKAPEQSTAGGSMETEVPKKVATRQKPGPLADWDYESCTAAMW